MPTSTVNQLGNVLNPAYDLRAVLEDVPYLGTETKAYCPALRRVVTHRQPIFPVEVDPATNQMMPSAGYLPLIRYAAEDYNIDCLSTHPIRALSATSQWGGAEIAPDLNSFLETNELGLVRYAQGIAVDKLIAQICLSFPTARIAIAVSSHDKAQCLRDKLEVNGVDLDETFILEDMYPGNETPRLGDHAKQCLTPKEMYRIYHRETKRIGVGILLDFADHFYGCKRDILIFPDAFSAVSELGFYPQFHWDDRFRVFGFLRKEENVSWSEEQKLRGAYGFAELTLLAHGRRNKPVHTELLRINIVQAGSEFSWKSDVWRNGLRNRLIIKRAKAERGAADRVVLLCASVDHLLSLSDRLRDWPLVTHRHVAMDGLAKRHRDKLEQATNPQPPSSNCYLATLAGYSRLEAVPREILLWAGSGPSGPEIPKKHLTCPQGMSSADHSIKFIDIRDGGQAQLRRWSRSRKNYYIDRGWYPVGICQANGNLIRYMHRFGGRA